jgi:ribosomal biogenesis protein LAS1
VSPQLVALWEPLFIQLQKHHPALPRTFINNIVARLSLSGVHTIDHVSEPLEVRHDPSYNNCIAKWAMWAVEKWIGVDSDIRRCTIISLTMALGPEFAANEARFVWITPTPGLITILLH